MSLVICAICVGLLWRASLHRPHVQAIKQELRTIQTVSIRAHDADLFNYIRVRLNEMKNINPLLEKRCLALAGGVKGL